MPHGKHETEVVLEHCQAPDELEVQLHTASHCSHMVITFVTRFNWAVGAAA